ncbi:hypothetical protein EMCRGX_G007297 [Ephydatia muelleri]|eukprot:Em0002g1174a
MQLLSGTVLLTVALLCKAASIGTLDGGSTIPRNGITTQQAGGSETTTVKSDDTTAMKSSDTAKRPSTLEELVKQVFASDDTTGRKPKLVTVGNTAADLTAAHTDTAVTSGNGGSTIPNLQENEMKTTSTGASVKDPSSSTIASVPSTGVVYNYLESTLVQKGFVKCYDQPYSHYTSSADLNACAGSEFVFVGAKSSSNANVFSIGAFGASVNVFKNTYSTSQAYYDAVGGAYWYRYPGWSFGFASSTSVNLNSCDYNNPDCSHRLCFHLDQNSGGYRAGCTVGLNGDSTWRKVIYKSPPSLPTCGVQYDYKESDLIQKGYVKCYEQPYSHATSSASLAACSGSEYVFVGAKKSMGASSFAIGAFGVTSNVFKSTYEQTNAVLDAGGAYWYRYPGRSFGFASSSTVNLHNCDYINLDCASRMCWHLDQYVGGYRAGCTVDLNYDSTWTKVIYSGKNLPTCSPVAVPSCGVLYNYPENALIQKSFTKCYDQPYSHATTSADLANCMGSSLVFVGAKSSSGSNTFALGAFGVSSNVMKITSSATQAFIDDGGAYWYRTPGWSFGFASSSSINLGRCDNNNPDCSHRLCFHLDQNVGGYRAGCTVGLNEDSTWRKVIYKGNYLNSCSPDTIATVESEHTTANKGQ